MLKIHALNRESSSDEDAPGIRREAQEEIALDMYNNALKLLSKGELGDSQKILQELIDENIPQLENRGGLPKTMSTIKYSCYINLGRIFSESENTKDALENYLMASELDDSDVTLWYKIGKMAISLDRFRQAAYAFSKGLECSESHWPCLDQLITLLYAIQDTIACLYYIGRALILDPYYIKGIVLKNKIYESNPGTKDYYKGFKTDYIAEPDLDISVSDEDKDECLKEVQILCDHINEVEKRLEPQPLPTIPLPTPLEEFSWLALGRTLIDLHNYITDNHMSHFSKVDLTKCMSQKMIVTDSKDVVENGNAESEPSEAMEIKTNGLKEPVVNEEEEKIEVDPVAIRRQSQNSENNGNDGTDNNVTPVQTDNDNDEMEQDTEDQDENAEQKSDKNRSQTRGTKRRRDLLSDLQIWGWHSKRKYVKKGKTEKDLTVEDALRRIIPPYLLVNGLEGKKTTGSDDSMNITDVYNLCASQNQVPSLSPIHSPRPHNMDENYFCSQQEKDDVLEFWTKKWESCDAVYMIEEYVFRVSRLWYLKWPKPLIETYVVLYNMFREHCDHPQPFATTDNEEELKNDCLATILYAELVQYNPQKNDKENQTIPLTSVSFLQLVSGFEDQWGDQFLPFFIRVHWLRTHLFRKDDNNLMAVQALQLVQEMVVAEEAKTAEKYILSLPNCTKHNLIITEIIEKLLKHLELINSLTQLETLYELKEYKKVAEVIKTTFSNGGNHPTCGRMGRPAQIGMLLHALWYTDFTECFLWAEECLCEALDYFLVPSPDRNRWEMVIQKCVAIMLEIIKSETVSVVDNLGPEKRARLVETLARIVCKQINAENTHNVPLGSLTPWIVLHYVLVREEHRMQAKKTVKHVRVGKEKDQTTTTTTTTTSEDEEEPSKVPPSIAVLFSAHQFLGPKGWCLTGQGELLHFMLDRILDRLDTPIFEKLRDKIDIHIEQAMFCLYQHPSKKNKVSRHLADHNVNPLPLSWERAHQLYEFYCPDRLPEFDSYRSISISSDLEQLLQRISALVPSECDPQPHIPKITDYVNGDLDTVPEPIEFPFKVKAIYYLLGDYYFKQNEVVTSIKYFLLDLCLNPLRLDTWACLALGMASQLESKLNHCERFKTESEFLNKARSAQVCFRQALQLAGDHMTLWIEFGSFEYMVHSFCSRILKYESENLSMEKFESLESVKDTYISSSRESFLHALDLHQPDQCDADERWLYHYMLAKIAEKQKKEPVEYLQHYLNAKALLEENNATYPDKISYTNPQHLSLEALEIHYRIHASILKYLELHEGKPILTAVGKIFKKCLNSACLPKKNYNKEQKVVAETDKKPEPEVNDEQLIWRDVKECMDDMVQKVQQQQQQEEKKPAEETTTVISLSDSDEDKNKPKPESVQDVVHALIEETINKPAEPMEIAHEISETAAQKAEIKETAEKSDTEKSVKDENKLESRSEDGGQSIRKSTDTSSTSTASCSSSSSASDSDSDESTTSTTTSSSDSNGNLAEAEVLNLVERCITGLEQCITRLPQNYKAIYRLAHLYFHYKPMKELTKCRQLLLGEYKCKNSVIVSGLFSDRKMNNFFNGIWRIPSSEIDRPGSLGAHMSRCVSLLLQVLRSTNDHKTLLDLCLQLRRTPDADKVYIRDAERKQLSEQAMSLCVQSLKTQMKNVNTNSQTALKKLLLDIFRVYQRVQKHIQIKESTFATMLTDVYKQLVQEKLPENVNVLDVAVKYCQQNKPTERPKIMSNYVPAARATALTANVPVLPTPTNVQTVPNPPLKRPSLGRPRGRPPGPKIAGSSRPRGRPSLNMNATYWQSQMMKTNAVYDYMKQYQEELIRQYSKTLTLNQLTQLGHYFTQSSLGNQFNLPSTSQNSLLNQAHLMPTMHSAAAAAAATTSTPHFGDAMKKKPIVDTLSVNLPTSTQMAAAFSMQHPLKPLSGFSAAEKPATKTSTTVVDPRLSQSGINPLNFIPTSAGKMQTHLGVQSTKSAFTMPVLTSAPSVSAAYKYTNADLSKHKTKTTYSYPQSFLDASRQNMIAKQVQKEKEKVKRLTSRPSISITPVKPVSVITTNVPKYVTPQPPAPPPPPQIHPSTSSPGKTLQEKLAEKQKQLSTKHAEAKAHAFPTSNIPSMVLPSSLTISRASNLPTFPLESGLSISEIPHAKPTLPKSDSSKMYRPEQQQQVVKSAMIPSSLPSASVLPTYKQPQGLSASGNVATSVGLPSNLPISLSVIKKPEKKVERQRSSDDDVIIIE